MFSWQLNETVSLADMVRVLLETGELSVTVKAFSPEGKLIEAKDSEEVIVKAGDREWFFACPEVPDGGGDVIKNAVVSRVRY